MGTTESGMRATADQVRVLIVDDDELFAESLASMLSDEEEIEVVGWVSNALDAISFVASEHPDVVLMDVAMPGENGAVAYVTKARVAIDLVPMLLAAKANRTTEPS